MNDRRRRYLARQDSAPDEVAGDDLAAVTMAAHDRLSAVLDQVESGELPAGPDQRAWLRGATDALRMVRDMGVSDPRQ
jgi:hypothetical protein